MIISAAGKLMRQSDSEKLKQIAGLLSVRVGPIMSESRLERLGWFDLFVFKYQMRVCISKFSLNKGRK